MIKIFNKKYISLLFIFTLTLVLFNSFLVLGNTNNDYSSYIDLNNSNCVTSFDHKSTKKMMEDDIYDTQANKVYLVAKDIEGTPGNCFYICRLFASMYYGENTSLADAYIVEDPKPGDFIYYVDGGLGIEHWAVYLGYQDALQGNFNGFARLKSMYIKNGSEPIFYRIP